MNKWRAKKGSGETKGDTQNKQRDALFRGKTGFFSLRSKERKEKTTKKKQQNNKKNKKNVNIHKNTKTFSYQSNFFGGVSKNSFFDNLAQKTRTPKTLYEIGVSAHQFLKNSYASRNGHFWTKNQIQKFQLSFFAYFSVSTTKNTKNAETPIYIVF